MYANYTIRLIYQLMKSRERCCLTPSINISIIQLPQNSCSIKNQSIHRLQASKPQLSLPPHRQVKPSIYSQNITVIESTKDLDDKDKKEAISDGGNQKRDNRSHKILHLLKRSCRLRNKSIDNQGSNPNRAKGSVSRSYYTNQRLSLSVTSKRITFLYYRRNHGLEAYLKPRTSSLSDNQAFFEPKDTSLPVRLHSNFPKKMMSFLNEKKGSSLQPIYSTISISSYQKLKKQPTDRSRLATSSIKPFYLKSKTVFSTTAKEPLRPWSRNSAAIGHMNQQDTNSDINMLGL